MAPTCSNCGGMEFVWANELKTGTGLSGTGTLSLRARGEIPLGTRVCRSCGHADLFLRDLTILQKPHTWRPGEFIPIQAKPRHAPTGSAHHPPPAPAPAPMPSTLPPSSPPEPPSAPSPPPPSAPSPPPPSPSAPPLPPVAPPPPAPTPEPEPIVPALSPSAPSPEPVAVPASTATPPEISELGPSDREPAVGDDEGAPTDARRSPARTKTPRKRPARRSA